MLIFLGHEIFLYHFVKLNFDLRHYKTKLSYLLSAVLQIAFQFKMHCI